MLKATKDMNSRELHRQSCEYNSIFISPQTYDSALLAVGSIFTVVEAVLTGQVSGHFAACSFQGPKVREAACVLGGTVTGWGRMSRGFEVKCVG